MKVKITIFVDGSNVAFVGNGKHIAKIWRAENIGQWRYRVEPTNYNGWTDRSQTTAIEDVKHYITHNLSHWGFNVEFETK